VKRKISLSKEVVRNLTNPHLLRVVSGDIQQLTRGANVTCESAPCPTYNDLSCRSYLPGCGPTATGP